MSSFQPSQHYIDYKNNFDHFMNQLSLNDRNALFGILEDDPNAETADNLLDSILLEQLRELLEDREGLKVSDFNDGVAYDIDDALGQLRQLMDNGMPEDAAGQAIVQQTIDSLGGWEAAQAIAEQSLDPDFDPSQLDPEVYNTLVNAANTVHTSYHSEVIITSSPVAEVDEFFDKTPPEIVGTSGENLLPPDMLPDTPEPSEPGISQPQRSLDAFNM